jgi:hypothetical protein
VLKSLYSVIWYLPRGLFDVRSFSNVLIRHDSSFPLEGYKVPLRVLFFTWLATLGKILTMDNLWKRYVIVVEWTCMCKKNGESVDHFLLHCEIVSALWNTIFSNVGLVWVMPYWVVDLFACWRALTGRFQFDVVWKIIPSCLM